ncbi:MAG: hypothetical protein VX686_00680, partial [Candidatus Thermoplasmatota archaeon]|nr:hypothetical protein [Candidatus Thermoplasmatota archaeon]
MQALRARAMPEQLQPHLGVAIQPFERPHLFPRSACRGVTLVGVTCPCVRMLPDVLFRANGYTKHFNSSRGIGVVLPAHDDRKVIG